MQIDRESIGVAKLTGCFEMSKKLDHHLSKKFYMLKEKITIFKGQ